MTILANSPAPCAYNASDSYNKVNPIKSYSFGIPHSKKSQGRNAGVPGPGAYTVLFNSQEIVRTFKLKGRLKNPCTYN